MTSPTKTCFIFIIKTNQYAGNFERQMCAWMTGVRGYDDNTGEEEADVFKLQHGEPDDFWSCELIQVMDDHGCERPCSIWGSRSQDVAIFFEKHPTKKEIEILRERAHGFATDRDQNGEIRSRYPTTPKPKHTLQIRGFVLLHHKVSIKREVRGEWKA